MLATNAGGEYSALDAAIMVNFAVLLCELDSNASAYVLPTVVLGPGATWFAEGYAGYTCFQSFWHLLAQLTMQGSAGPNTGTGHVPQNPQPGSSASTKNEDSCQGYSPGPYSNTKGRKLTIAPGRDFSEDQIKDILQQNVERWRERGATDGLPHDDVTGQPLDWPSGPAGVYNPNKASVDHICPRAKGGTNAYSNACVRALSANISKSDNGPYTCGEFGPYQLPLPGMQGLNELVSR